MDAQGQRVRRVLPPVNGAVGNCTDTLVSGTSCVPTCDAGYVLEGVTSCTDRVLTEAVCDGTFTDRRRAQGRRGRVRRDRLCRLGTRCRSSDRLCWHPDPDDERPVPGQDTIRCVDIA